MAFHFSCKFLPPVAHHPGPHSFPGRQRSQRQPKRCAPAEPKRLPKQLLTAADWDLARELRRKYEYVTHTATPTFFHLLWQMLSFVTLAAVAFLSKGFMNLFTTTEVVNAQCLIDILDERETTPRPLITVANHISALDDPLLWGFLPLRQLLNRNKVRWCLAAKELLFTNRLFITFFTLGQTMPLARGAGIFQPYLDNAIHRLNQNKWVHLFPEGKIDQTPAFSYFRWGVARLVMEADATPLVVPIWHTGMDKLFPTEPSRRPLVLGQRMKIVVGEPLDFAPLLQQSRLENWSPAVTRARITERVKEAIQLLEKKHRIPA